MPWQGDARDEALVAPVDGDSGAVGACASGGWDVIWTVAYNTTHYGASPIGEGAACFSSSGGCGYDSLNDSDGDGVCDAIDNCVGIANANQADAENDGVGNVCDNCASTANTTQTDADGDHVGDACDNCAAVANANQANADGDALGDVCDACPLDASNDADGDAVCGNVFPNTWKMTLRQAKVGDVGSPAAPVVVHLSQPTLSIDRSDDISACTARTDAVSCKER